MRSFIMSTVAMTCAIVIAACDSAETSPREAWVSGSADTAYMRPTKTQMFYHKNEIPNYPTGASCYFIVRDQSLGEKTDPYLAELAVRQIRKQFSKSYAEKKIYDMKFENESQRTVHIGFQPEYILLYVSRIPDGKKAKTVNLYAFKAEELFDNNISVIDALLKSVSIKSDFSSSDSAEVERSKEFEESERLLDKLTKAAP